MRSVHFYAVDMLGHGESHYGGKTATESEQLDALEQLIRSEILGRGTVLINIAKQKESKTLLCLEEVMGEELPHYY
jgi:hypothetical protein